MKNNKNDQKSPFLEASLVSKRTASLKTRGNEGAYIRIQNWDFFYIVSLYNVRKHNVRYEMIHPIVIHFGPKRLHISVKKWQMDEDMCVRESS